MKTKLSLIVLVAAAVSLVFFVGRMTALSGRPHTMVPTAALPQASKPVKIEWLTIDWAEEGRCVPMEQVYAAWGAPTSPDEFIRAWAKEGVTFDAANYGDTVILVSRNTGNPTPFYRTRASCDEAIQRATSTLAAAEVNADSRVVYTRSEFEALVRGKSKQEVIALLGNPVSVSSGIHPGEEYYDYGDTPYGDRQAPAFIVSEEATGLQMRFVSVWFNALGQVDEVRY